MAPTLIQQEREGVAEHFSEQVMAQMPQASHLDTLDEVAVHELTEDHIDPVTKAAEDGTVSGPGGLPSFLEGACNCRPCSASISWGVGLQWLQPPTTILCRPKAALPPKHRQRWARAN